MNSPMTYSVVDEKDLDDAALWAVIDSAAAASLSSSTTKPRNKSLTLSHTTTNFQSPTPKNPRNHHNYSPHVEIFHDPHSRPYKIARSLSVSELTETSPSPLAVVKHVQRTPNKPMVTTSAYSSPIVKECGTSSYDWQSSPAVSYGQQQQQQCEEREPMNTMMMRHSLSGRFPSVSLFKEYQNAAMAILEKSDYTMISGSPYIKKSGWRKISFYFNVSYEIKDKSIEVDENRNVQRAEFVVRAHMQGGRFSDGWGSCDRREKRFSKPNHDVPSTAETRAKNKACQDLLGIGEYRPGVSHAPR